MIFFPELVRLAMMFPKLSGWNQLVKVTIPMRKVFDDAVVEHEQNPADKDHPRDFIDAYINEISNTTDPNSSFYKETGR